MGWKASGGQASERPEATWLQPPQQDLQVKYGERGPPAQRTGRQESRPSAILLPPVHPPGSRPTREIALSGYPEGYPDGPHATRLPQGREREANLDHEWREAIADGPPEPGRDVQRTPTQRHGSPPPTSKRRKSFPWREPAKAGAFMRRRIWGPKVLAGTAVSKVQDC